MPECPTRNYAECTAQAVRRALATRGASPRPKEYAGACKGTQRLNKIAFLSMIGAKKYTPPKGSTASAALMRLEELREKISESEGDMAAAARSLGITPSRLKARYNYLLSQESMTTVEGDEYSAYPERKFYESLSRPWSITAFDPVAGEVCVDIEAGSTVTHLSSTVATRRNPY